MPSGIYTITSPSGAIYVGSAVDIERRWVRHRKDLRAGTHGNLKLTRSAAKYGRESLLFDILLICAPSDLLMYEQRAIDILRPIYNIAQIAGSCIGIKRSDEFKARVSAGGMGHKVSAETRAKIGAAHRGKKLTPEQIKKWHTNLPPTPSERAAFMLTPESKAKKAKAMIGHPTSEETKAKISATLKGRPHSPERIAAIAAGKARRAITLQNGG